MKTIIPVLLRTKHGCCKNHLINNSLCISYIIIQSKKDTIHQYDQHYKGVKGTKFDKELRYSNKIYSEKIIVIIVNIVIKWKPSQATIPASAIEISKPRSISELSIAYIQSYYERHKVERADQLIYDFKHFDFEAMTSTFWN